MIDAAAEALAQQPEIDRLKAQALQQQVGHDALEAPLSRLMLSADPHWRAPALLLRARAAFARGTPQTALTDLHAAVALLDPNRERVLLARVLSGLGLT